MTSENLEGMTVEQALVAVDMIQEHTVFSMEDIALSFHAARVLAAEVRTLRAELDLSPEELEQAVEVARSLDDTDLTEFRHGRKNPRNLYSGDGAEHHFAVVVGADEHAEYVASWLIDAARAWEAAGHPFPPAPDTVPVSPGPVVTVSRDMIESPHPGVMREHLHVQDRQPGNEVW